MTEPQQPRTEMWPAIVPVNKFHAGNGNDGRHYWLTPPDLYARLDAEFHFDFDPCPYPLPDGFDGLTCEWGRSNYVNPPFGSIIHEGRKKGPTAWVRKAITEYRKGKLVVLVYPIDKWVLMLLDALGTDVRNLGDVRWCATEDGRPGPGTGRHIACFVLDPRGVPDGPAPPDPQGGEPLDVGLPDGVGAGLKKMASIHRGRIGRFPLGVRSHAYAGAGGTPASRGTVL